MAFLIPESGKLCKTVTVVNPFILDKTTTVVVEVTAPTGMDIDSVTASTGTFAGTEWTITDFVAGVNPTLDICFVSSIGIDCPTGTTLTVAITSAPADSDMGNNTDVETLEFLTICDITSSISILDSSLSPIPGSGTTSDPWVLPAGTSAVASVNGNVGAVVLGTDDIAEGATNLYYTEARVSANTDVASSKTVTDFISITQAVDLDSVETRQSSLITLTGLPAGTTSLGTFTGSTIADNVDLKTALQTLETSLETSAGTDLSAGTVSATTYQIVSSTGTDVTLPEATGVAAGLLGSADKTKLDFISVTQAVDLDAIESVVSDLNTLSGVAVNATDLGTFTGATIPDNSTLKTALQELETAVEGAVAGATNLSAGTVTGTTYEVLSSTGTDLTLPSATATDAGVLPAADKVKLDFLSVTQVVDLDALETQQGNLVTLTGLAANSTDLGTFSGSTIADNVGLKAALQTLETSLEAATGTTNLSVGTVTGTTVDVNSDTGTNVTLPAATSSDAGVMPAADKVKSDFITITQAVNLDNVENGFLDIITLTGLPAFTTDLGTFTGSTIADNSDLVTALQALETAVEAATGATNLSVGTTTATTVDINSDTGTNVTLPAATTSDAGILSATDKTKLDNLKEYLEIDDGKSKMWAVSGTSLDNTTQGIFEYTMAEFGDISSLSLAIERTTDSKGSGDLDIIFKFSDNSVNTWQAGDTITDFDLFVPQFACYNWSATLISVNSMTPVVIDPEVTFGSGEVQLRFLDSSNYGSISRVLFVFNFPSINT